VQFSTINKPVPKDQINSPPAPATGVQVSWRKSHGLPEAVGRGHQRHPPNAVEAVTGTPLPVRLESDGYRVDLPEFQFMALLVVAEISPSRGQRRLQR
jgi:hypothetical protein